MKIFKIINTNKQERIIQDIVCNLCGKKIPKNDLGYYEDYINIKKSWGYHSNFDGETHLIDICQCCYKELIEKCTIKDIIQKD